MNIIYLINEVFHTEYISLPRFHFIRDLKWTCQFNELLEGLTAWIVDHV